MKRLSPAIHVAIFTLGIALARHPLSANDHPSVIAEVNRKMAEMVERGEMSGAVTCVADGVRVLHLGAVGHSDIENDQPMQTDALFAIASMTKPITATAILMLQDEGKLSVDDPVAKYIPSFANLNLDGKPFDQPITIKHVMTHTAGIVNVPHRVSSLAKTAEKIAAEPLKFKPGSKWQYSSGLTVCGRIIEIVSGESYPEFLRQRIFEPLGMHDTMFFPNEQQRARVATMYQPGEDEGSLRPSDSWLSDLMEHRAANPSGGLYSTAQDMTRFYQMVLNGGVANGKRVVSQDAVEQMTTVQSGDVKTGFTPGNGWGLGWCVVREPQGVSEMLSPGTFGHGGAFGTQGWVDPGQELIFVLLIQRTNFGNSDDSIVRQSFQHAAVDALR